MRPDRGLDRRHSQVRCLDRWGRMNTNGTPTLIGIPYDASSSYLRGAARAPARIREALRSPSSNSWSERLVDTGAPGLLVDTGDVRFVDGRDPRDTVTTVIRRVLEDGGRPVSLGGDHSVTLPILRAVRPHVPKLTILHVDAHPDLYDSFDGDPFSHACPFARILEEGLADRLVQAGIRTMNGHQLDQVRRFGVDVVDMLSWDAGRRPVVEGPVYVTIDIDGIDPAFAPGVSHPEPGGLSVRDVIRLIEGVRGNVVGADVVEYNPTRDVGDATAFVCAKLVKELVASMMPDRAVR